jgi:hypothetical protein
VRVGGVRLRVPGREGDDLGGGLDVVLGRDADAQGVGLVVDGDDSADGGHQGLGPVEVESLEGEPLGVRDADAARQRRGEVERGALAVDDEVFGALDDDVRYTSVCGGYEVVGGFGEDNLSVAAGDGLSDCGGEVVVGRLAWGDGGDLQDFGRVGRGGGFDEDTNVGSVGNLDVFDKVVRRGSFGVFAGDGVGK